MQVETNDPISLPKEFDAQSQLIPLMRFNVDSLTALVAMGHVNSRKFRQAARAAAAQSGTIWGDKDDGSSDRDWWKYEYAIFGERERILLGVEPDEPEAKPVTVSTFYQMPKLKI